jgi:hypothetical protein
MLKACPEECTFDWADFHNRLDIATAHLIEETKRLPSKTTLMEFLSYSYDKKLLQEGEKEA